MKKFYKESVFWGICVILATIVFLYSGNIASHRSETLFPTNKGQAPWIASKEPLTNKDNESLRIKNSPHAIEYDFVVSRKEKYSYTAYILDFLNTPLSQGPVDHSKYQSIIFRISCQPENILLFAVFSFDDLWSTAVDSSTHRVSSTFFTCNSKPKDVVINFSDIDTPDWWLEKFDYPLTSKRDFRRDKVSQFRFINSLQSPRGIQSKVKIESIRLTGVSHAYIYISICIVVALWLAFTYWVIQQYLKVSHLQKGKKNRQNTSIIAYKKLSITPSKDTEKDVILNFMATHYSDSDLNIETVINKTGLNRHKINNALKSELGLTFSTYLNKLRLTEAARLLTEEGKVKISEVAYTVGYNNVSYFARLFKAEYGCSPKIFKDSKNI